MPDGQQPARDAASAGTRDLRLGELFDTLGKGIAVVAGLAIFVYIVGGLTMVARMERLDLPAEVVIPEIPRERLAVLGLAQVLWTLILGGLIAAVALWLMPSRRHGESWPLWRRRVLRDDRHWWISAAVVLASIVLIAPASANGAIYLGLLLLGVAWFVGWGRGVNPLVAMAVVLVVSGAVTVLRQLEFPSPFTYAHVSLKADAAELVPEVSPTSGYIIARMIEVSDDDLLMAYESPEQNASEEATGERRPPVLLTIPRDSVQRISYRLPKDPQSHSNSIAQHLFGLSPSPLPLMCLIPTCEWDETDDVESDEPSFSAPFVF
jgi:hypothetical protein